MRKNDCVLNQTLRVCTVEPPISAHTCGLMHVSVATAQAQLQFQGSGFRGSAI